MREKDRNFSNTREMQKCDDFFEMSKQLRNDAIQQR